MNDFNGYNWNNNINFLKIKFFFFLKKQHFIFNSYPHMKNCYFSTLNFVGSALPCYLWTFHFSILCKYWLFIYLWKIKENLENKQRTAIRLRNHKHTGDMYVCINVFDWMNIIFWAWALSPTLIHPPNHFLLSPLLFSPFSSPSPSESQ